MRHFRDNQIKATALKMWANYIESGDVNVSAEDLLKVQASPNELTEEQAEFVARLKNMASDEADSWIMR